MNNSNLIFGYGSLINPNEVKEFLDFEDWEDSFEILGIGRLDNYRLAFTRESKNWLGGVLDVIPSEGDYVLGVVLKLNQKALESFDRKKRVSSDLYKRELKEIIFKGEKHLSFTYTVVYKNLNEFTPSKEYFDKMIRGMYLAQFPNEYINDLKEKYIL